MANKESTAVNALIDLVQVKPVGSPAGTGDDFFAPPQPRASGTPAPSRLPPPRSGPVPVVHKPVPQPVSHRPVPQPVVHKPVPQPVPQPAPHAYVSAPNGAELAPYLDEAALLRASTIDQTGDAVSAEDWFESSRAIEKLDSIDATYVGTAPQVRIERQRRRTLIKIIGTSVGFVVIGLIIGSLVASHGDDHAAAPATKATVVQPMPPAQTGPQLADVRIDSTPPGATVMVVDGTQSTFLGTTPIATALDPSHAYDIVFTLDGRPAKTMHFDPAVSPHVAVMFDRPSAAAREPAMAQREAASPSRESAEPARHRAVHVAAAPGGIIDPFASGAASSTGTLMVASKPPCELVIDGRATGLHTPQRSLPLAAGAHKITFVNAAQHISRTIAISVTASQTTKLVENLLK